MFITRSLALGFTLAGLLGCGSAPGDEPPATPAEPREAPPTPAPAHWVQRTDRELAAELKRACQASQAAGRPVLLMFSAAWCQDCVLIHKHSTAEPLAHELKNWEVVVADVGRFDRHDLFRNVFGVTGLAWWVATRPTDCEAMPHTWPRLREGLLEPASNPGGTARVDALSGWLAEARAR